MNAAGGRLVLMFGGRRGRPGTNSLAAGSMSAYISLSSSGLNVAITSEC